MMTTCQAINCGRDGAYVAQRKSDGAQRVTCGEVACIVTILSIHGVSNMFELKESPPAS